MGFSSQKMPVLTVGHKRLPPFSPCPPQHTWIGCCLLQMSILFEEFWFSGLLSFFLTFDPSVGKYEFIYVKSKIKPLVLKSDFSSFESKLICCKCKRLYVTARFKTFTCCYNIVVARTWCIHFPDPDIILDSLFSSGSQSALFCCFFAPNASPCLWRSCPFSWETTGTQLEKSFHSFNFN